MAQYVWISIPFWMKQMGQEILSNYNVDVVLIDREVDQEDGFQGIQKLIEDTSKSDRSNTRLVDITGSEKIADKATFGLDAYLTKPFTHEELRQALHLPACD